MIKPHRGRHRTRQQTPEQEQCHLRQLQSQSQRWRLHNSQLMVVIAVILALFQIQMGNCNLPPIFTQDMNNEAFQESTPVGTVVYKLEGYDPEGGNVTFGLIDSGNFMVDPQTGQVRIVKALDREREDTLQFLVSIKDRVNASGDSENDNVVQVPITVIVLDDNDNPPEFENVPYEVDVLEDAPVGTTVFDKIMVTDKDSVGENLDVECVAQPQHPDACDVFKLVLLRSDQNILQAALVLNGKLDYNDKMIYHIQLRATDSVHAQTTEVEIRVKDVQNTPPVFLGSLAAVIDEDSPIGTLVMTVQARDGDKGQPRRISYELITNPMDYFLLDAQTGELRTGKPLDKEALPDATGLIMLVVKAHEIVDGQPGNDELTSATTQVSITIRDVNDSPPVFNKREYFATLHENTPIGTPLPLDISVRDPDVGQNSIFALRLSDVSGVFDVEPKTVTGSSQITISVAKGALDYENPNQRKFIVLIIAEETETESKLSSTATLTVSIVDTNDNRPQFDHDSYSATVSELAAPGQLVTTITARDLDSGDFGEKGLRYSIFGKGSELFHVDEETGAITVAPCDAPEQTINHRVVRQINGEGEQEQEQDDLPTGRVNVTHNSQFGILHIPESNTDRPDYVTYQVGESSDYDLFHSHETTVALSPVTEATPVENIVPKRGRAPCLDFETQPVYYLSFRATDDLGRGQSSVVSLRILVKDENDSPPQCESPLYRASVDEGAKYFDPPLIVKARDADEAPEVTYSIVAPEHIRNMFRIDKRTGQLSISPDSSLDVNHLKSEHVSFAVQAHDGQFTALCRINITIRDVNNHSPQFKRSHFVSTIAEDLPIGTIVDRIEAFDLDKGENAEIVYRLQQGSFDDFQINNRTGDIVLTRKLDFDRRNTYQIEVVASDLGTPSLSGSATVTINVLNSNDKAPYFTPSTQRAEVAEDATVGALVHQLVAVDPDIVSNEALAFAATEPIMAVDKDGNEVASGEDFKDMFRVERNGQVIVNRKLDRDSYSVIRITVLVTDTTAPTVQQGKGLLILTIIDINEHPPLFVAPWTAQSPKYYFKIREEQPVGTILTTLQATDKDSAIAEFNLEAPNDFFEIKPLTGVVKIKSRIDYEQIKSVAFSVIVTDAGVPQLSSKADISVEIQNINDNEPTFNTTASAYEMSIEENAPVGAPVGRVEAHDADLDQYGEIEYEIVGENQDVFSINRQTGEIFVHNSSALDREARQHFVITVVASDKAPVAIRKSTAIPVQIKLKDVNDNPPIFAQSQYFAEVAENVAINPPAKILKVSATDGDENNFGIVNYFILAGDERGFFKLDPNSGILYPSRALEVGNYSLRVEARDDLGHGPHSDTSEIYVTVLSINHHHPVFVMPALTNSTVELPYNEVEADYLVMTVKATDADTGLDGKVTYHLQVNDKIVQNTEEFVIDAASGELRTRKRLNRKEVSKYQLVLFVTDQGRPNPFSALTFLTILLVDMNENRPEFPDASNPYKFSVQENGESHQRIGKIQAMIEERNDPIFYYIILGNEEGAFSVDKTSGDIFTAKSLDREEKDSYNLFILASRKPDLHITSEERDNYQIDALERDSTVAKVWISVQDVNDNAPVFEKRVYNVGINSKANINELVTLVNATDLDMGANGTLEMLIVSSNLYKFGSNRSTGSIVPSPFAISKDGRITTAGFMAEYNQDRFVLEVVAKEVEPPERFAKTIVNVWIFNTDQLIRVILSRPPSEVNSEREEIIAELSNATSKRIIVDEIRYHVDSMGRIRMDWCDLYFHAVDEKKSEIVPVDDILKLVDSQYDSLRDYYAGYAIENIVPAQVPFVEEEFDIALAAVIALLIILFIGIVTCIVLCCCLKNWVTVSQVPMEIRRKDALIKKQQIIEDLNTTENPLWIEQKLKLYEEQELTMQVFSEPENMNPQSTPPPHNNNNMSMNNNLEIIPPNDLMDDGHLLGRRDSYDPGDNTYATIQPRTISSQVSSGELLDDYATLRNNHSATPSMYEFTGSTFQVAQRGGDQSDFVTELF